MALKFLLIVACVLVLFTEQHRALQCKEVSGTLKQIDAGSGRVFGVNANDEIFARYGEKWFEVPGSLSHVSVGPAGVWGVDRDEKIYKRVNGDWVPVIGQKVQVDAGGDKFVVGVNSVHKVYCLNEAETVIAQSLSAGAAWKQFPGTMAYCSCGPLSCWGVNDQGVFCRERVSPADCVGHYNWKLVDRKLVMVEVSTDGHVYGVDAEGYVYSRDGISTCKPEGNGWIQLDDIKGKHVSYDRGHLWVITPEDKILDCAV